MKKLALFLAIVTILTSFASCGRRQELLEQIESEKVAESIADIEEKETNTIHLDTRPRETLASVPDTEPPISGETHAPTETQDPSDTAPASPDDTLPPADTGTATPPTPSGSYPNDEGYRLTGVVGTGDKGCYEGVTADDLKARFEPMQDFTNSSSVFKTPTGILFQKGKTCYNKLTGNMSRLCPDPLCRHDTCAWGQLKEFVYFSEDHIYFTAGATYSDQWLFRSDLERNHVEELGINLFDGGAEICSVNGDKIYMQKDIYQENMAGYRCYGVYDCGTQTFTDLSGKVMGKQDVYVTAVTGETIWYTDARAVSLYRANLDFSESERMFADLGELGIRAFSNDYLILAEYRKAAKYIYNISTGKLTDIEGRVNDYALDPILSGKYLYYTKKITDAEIAVSPWKEYFNYSFTDPVSNRPYSPVVKDAGQIFRMNLETGEDEVVLELSYNGVPIAIKEFMVDGDAVYVGYLTYEDFNNYYNQDYHKGTFQMTHAESKRYLYVDMQNGTVNLLDPYSIG